LSSTNPYSLLYTLYIHLVLIIVAGCRINVLNLEPFKHYFDSVVVIKENALEIGQNLTNIESWFGPFHQYQASSQTKKGYFIMNLCHKMSIFHVFFYDFYFMIFYEIWKFYAFFMKNMKISIFYDRCDACNIISESNTILFEGSRLKAGPNNILEFSS